MRYLLCTFLYVSLFSFSFGQEKTIKGLIIIDFEDSSAEGIFVTNSRTNITTVTDLTGSFSIRVAAGDDLQIRSFLYESRRFTITESLLKNDEVKIHLSLQPVMLEEAIISPKLTGYLDKDVKYDLSKDQLAKLYKELGFNPDVSKLRDSTSLSFWKDYSPLHFNVERVLESVTGDLRRRKSLYAFEGREAVIEHIQKYFGKDYFMQDLKIPEEKIRDFVFYSYESSPIPQLYTHQNYLGIMIEFNRLAPIYLARLKSWQLK